jgi:hypothetical protein
MAEYVYAQDQEVLANENVLLQDSIPCNRGYVMHRNDSGILTLRGIVNNPCARFARYFVEFNGNIALPEGGTPGEISMALAIDGEALQTPKARVTPTAVEAFFNVTSVAFITVPAGCCLTISVENTSGVPITVANANLVVNRTA